MTRLLRTGFRSAMMWQVALGFVLGTAVTFAARDAQAERQPRYAGAATHWRIDR